MKVPIKNLSSFEQDTTCLQNGLNHSFVDKNKFIKRDLAVEMESLASYVDKDVIPEQKEEFHEFLRANTKGSLKTFTTLKTTLSSRLKASEKMKILLYSLETRTLA